MRFPVEFWKPGQGFEIPAQDLIFWVEIFPSRVFHTLTWISGCVLKHSLIFWADFKTWVESFPNWKYRVGWEISSTRALRSLAKLQKFNVVWKRWDVKCDGRFGCSGKSSRRSISYQRKPYIIILTDFARQVEQSVMLVRCVSGSNIIPVGLGYKAYFFLVGFCPNFRARLNQSWVKILTEWKSFSRPKIWLCFAPG